jgi:hypothetical protein
MTEKPKFSGMTVNERLSTAGVLREFDEAILLRDRGRAIAILTSVDVETPDHTVDMIFEHPGKYGYY